MSSRLCLSVSEKCCWAAGAHDGMGRVGGGGLPAQHALMLPAEITPQDQLAAPRLWSSAHLGSSAPAELGR